MLRGPHSSSGSHETYPTHMDRQARTGDTVLVKSREMTGSIQTLPWQLGEKG
jgi:hypothetical protein